jgi:poly(hydroxyalkanoate) depolymerase family esterase
MKLLSITSIRKIYFSAVLSVAFISMAAQPLVRIKHFGKNPGHLKMYLYAPASIDKSKPVPLVVMLHGCLQCPGSAAALTGWNKLANEQGFYVLYPGQRITNNPQKCFRWYRRRHINKNRGENYSVKSMIDFMKKNYVIDSANVFVTGLSAGAAMGVVMMADYPETFKAGAIFAGVPYKTATSLVPAMLTFFGWRIKTPEKWGEVVRKQNLGYTGKYPKLIIYQGNNDIIVNKRNAVELMKQWSNLHHIGTQPTETLAGYSGIPDIERNSYRNAEDEEVITFYKINKLGHALLIDPGKSKNQGGRHGVFSKDKGYHSTYRTAIEFGLIAVPDVKENRVIK